MRNFFVSFLVLLAACGSTLSEKTLLATVSLVNTADQRIASDYRKRAAAVRQESGFLEARKLSSAAAVAYYREQMKPQDEKVLAITTARELVLAAGRAISSNRKADTDPVALATLGPAVAAAATLLGDIPELQPLRASLCGGARALLTARGLPDPCAKGTR